MTSKLQARDNSSGSRHLYGIEYDAEDGSLTPLKGQPIIDLYRSLTIGGIVAFVGSGTSYLLEYNTWDALADDLLKLASESDGKDSLPGRLQKALDKAYIESGLSKGDTKLDKFDRLALATEALRQMEKSDIAAGREHTLRRTFDFKLPRKRSDAEELVGKLRDDPGLGLAQEARALEKWLGAARYLPIDFSRGIALVEALVTKDRSAAESQAHELAKAFADNASRLSEEEAAFLKREILDEAEPLSSGSTKTLVDAILAAADSPRPDSVSSIISVLSAAFLRAPQEKVKALTQLLTKFATESLEPRDLLNSAAPSIDVLDVLRREWGIKRYATLNYDHEIERMIERSDYPFYSITPASIADRAGRNVDDPQEHRDQGKGRTRSAQSRLGSKARSVDLDRHNVAEFMLFAAGCPPGVSQVLHLHGSVKDPRQMIVTDIDYNRRYFTNNVWTDLLEDSQELLYRSNAIVFVGVGMNEDVLFRAMRILSQAPDRDARPVYAFMQTQGEAKDTAEAIKLFQRYGIRTIHYGTRLGDGLDPETGEFPDHPLVKDARAFIGDSAPASGDLAKSLNPLTVELEFLGLLKESVNSAIRALETEKRVVESDFGSIATKSCAITSNGGAFKGPFEPFSSYFDVARIPRLMLTPWHSDVFRLIWKLLSVSNRKSSPFWNNLKSIHALRDAIVGLETAVHSRALHDALQSVSFKSMRWRDRWREKPGGERGRFRSEAHAARNDNICVHNIARFHTQMLQDRALLGAILSDGSGELYLEQANNMLAKRRLVVARSRNGSGKGILATGLARRPRKRTDTPRLVVSFGQSCGRDSVFDLIAHHLVEIRADRHGNGNRRARLEIVLSKCDTVMMVGEKRPKLAEWQALLQMTIQDPKVALLVLCDNNETREYFRKVSQDCRDLWLSQEEPVVESIDPRVVPVGVRVDHLEKVHRIARECRSVWVAAFLIAIYSTTVLNKSDKTPSEIKGTGFETMMARIAHAVGMTQDPRQRVPAVIDTAIGHIEHYVVNHRSIEEKVIKIISHAILKYMLAFGGPVEGSVFRVCPEVVKICEDYEIAASEIPGYVRASLCRLKRLGLVARLAQCYSGRGGSSLPRYGLHGHVRNWLSTKKGMPFAVVMGREQTAITVVPIIDEELVPLDQGDYRFVWDAVDALLRSGDAGKVSSQRIRAAFLMIRGSTRIGTVLRSPHGDEPHSGHAWTALEEYLRRLLAIRHAALMNGDGGDAELPPLFEREWVWLFNEMGVVKLLQGHAADAVCLFEQAIHFETERLRSGKCFENLVYEKRGFPEFSITKLRIMMNLALAEIERGAFNRAKRILSSEKRDLHAVEDLFDEPRKEGAGGGASSVTSGSKTAEFWNGSVLLSKPAAGAEKSLHREIRLLLLVQGLIDARLKFLSGGTGEALQWLNEAQDDIIREGVHGLTSLYYLYLGDIHKRAQDLAQASGCLSLARAEAEASGRSDLVFSVMLAESECRIGGAGARDAMDLQQQLTKIRKIKHEARTMGMTRIVVTASMIRARLYLSFGEYRSARQDLMTALTLSTANALNVKRVSALIDMAALVGSLDAELRGEAKEIAEAARFEAERMGYKLAAARAKDLELVLREQGSIEEWVLRQDRGVSAGRGDAD